MFNTPATIKPVRDAVAGFVQRAELYKNLGTAKSIIKSFGIPIPAPRQPQATLQPFSKQPDTLTPMRKVPTAAEQAEQDGLRDEQAKTELEQIMEALGLVNGELQQTMTERGRLRREQAMITPQIAEREKVGKQEALIAAGIALAGSLAGARSEYTVGNLQGYLQARQQQLDAEQQIEQANFNAQATAHYNQLQAEIESLDLSADMIDKERVRLTDLADGFVKHELKLNEIEAQGDKEIRTIRRRAVEQRLTQEQKAVLDRTTDALIQQGKDMAEVNQMRNFFDYIIDNPAIYFRDAGSMTRDELFIEAGKIAFSEPIGKMIQNQLTQERVTGQRLDNAFDERTLDDRVKQEEYKAEMARLRNEYLPKEFQLKVDQLDVARQALGLRIYTAFNEPGNNDPVTVYNEQLKSLEEGKKLNSEERSVIDEQIKAIREEVDRVVKSGQMLSPDGQKRLEDLGKLYDDALNRRTNLEGELFKLIEEIRNLRKQGPPKKAAQGFTPMQGSIPNGNEIADAFTTPDGKVIDLLDYVKGRGN